MLSKYCDRVAFQIHLSIWLKQEQWDCLVYEVLSSSVGVFSFHFFGTWIVCDQSSGHGAFFDLWAIRAPIPLVCYQRVPPSSPILVNVFADEFNSNCQQERKFGHYWAGCSSAMAHGRVNQKWTWVMEKKSTKIHIMDWLFLVSNRYLLCTAEISCTKK